MKTILMMVMVVISAVSMAENGENGIRRITPRYKSTRHAETIEFVLPGGDVLEFIKCPAGSFELGYKGGDKKLPATDPDKPRKASISHSFWISKFLVTQGQWDSYMDGGIMEKKANGGDNAWRNMVRKFSEEKEITALCTKLTKDYGDKIPAGCIIRLPSNAEWEYASKYNENFKGIMRKWSVSHEERMEYSADLEKEMIGMKRPSMLGVYDMVKDTGAYSEWTLDTFSATDKSVILVGDWGVIQKLTYPVDGKDILFAYKGKDEVKRIFRGCECGRWKTFCNGRDCSGHGSHSVRLVIGHDIAAAKDIKKAKAE